MVGTTYNDKTMKVGITLPNSLIKRTDRLRGDVPRSTYIRRALEYYLKQGNIRWRFLFWELQDLATPVAHSVINDVNGGS